MDPLSSFWLIPFYPLIGSALIGVLRRGAALIAPLAVGLSFLHTVAATLSARPAELTHTIGGWLPGIPFAFQFDDLSAFMCLIVSGIGLLIHLYSLGYMGGQENFTRYFGSLNLFVFFMLLLVLANNLVLLFAGWEGVGLASYLLIGFHFDKTAANKAANKAFLYNRAGDAGFLAGVFVLLANYGSVEFSKLQHIENGPMLLAAGLLLALGASGKSAQLPLYVWLPDAMVGPTPVSALIHAATMVTAGVYLFARLEPMYALIPQAGLVIAAVGALTSLIAATIALVEFDIKRILAYSTISQLGLMFMACGLGAPQAALFHVATHAFFKALLFLCAGNVIHALKGEQDLRYMGGLKQSMPWTFRLMTVGALGLAGLPGLSGFFSKDEIFAAAAGSPYFLGVGFLVAFLTACYSSRLIWRVFHGEQQQAGHDPHGWELHTLWPLALGTVIAGYFHPNAQHVWWIMGVSSVLALLGLWVGKGLENGREVGEPLHTLFKHRWYVDELYRALWLRGVGLKGSSGLSSFDAKIVGAGPAGAGVGVHVLSAVSGWVDRYLVDGVVRLTAILVEAVSYPVRLAQTGGMLQYALVVLLTMAGFFGYYWIRFGGRP